MKQKSILEQGTLAFLGPKGTFSQEAARSFVAHDDQLIECATISEIFELSAAGKSDFGIVPVENSLEGSVNATLDEFAFGDQVDILAEKTLDIHHAIIARSDASLDTIKTVISHPQATGQCRRWIARNLPGRQIVAANSTADAVKQAMEDQAYAAIGPAIAASLYGGSILANRIEDRAGNQTRFLLIGKGELAPTGNDKTSLALFLKADKPGALLMILAEFAYAGINLTKIASRPTKQALGEYMFFVDFAGHSSDPDIKTALDSLKLKLRDVKVLGSYPCA